MHRIAETPPQILAIIIGAIFVVLVHLIRGGAKSTRILILGTVMGVIAGVAAIAGALGFLDLHRNHRVSPLLGSAVASASLERQQIVLVGQSLSFYGIDGALLEKILNQRNSRFQVVQLTVEGVSPIEQDYILNSYLAHAPHPPTAIFFDVGFDSDYWPAVPWDQTYDPLTIAASDWTHTWRRIVSSWELNWTRIREGWPDNLAAVYGYSAQFTSDVAMSFGHFICNTMNCGEIQQLNPLSSGYSTGYAFRIGHAPQFKDSDIADPFPLKCDTGDNFSRLRTSLSMRRWQNHIYLDRGVKLIAFYKPPLLRMSQRCFAVAFCQKIGNSPCLNGEDPALFAELKSPDKWFDQNHLNASGVPYYTQSFARDVIHILHASGVYDGLIGESGLHP
jgi:hypothetical protein